MASARSVDYIFQLIDRFSPIAQKLAQSAAQAEKMIAVMGRAADQAERSVGRGAANAIQQMNARALEANPALRNATERLRAFGAAGERAAGQVRTLEQAHKAIIKMEKNAALERRYTGSGVPVMDGRKSATQSAGLAFMSGYMLKSATTGFSHFLDTANHELLAKQKMKLNAFSDEQLKQADVTSQKLSGKYKNLSKGDVLDQIYEGISIHGTPKLAIEEVEMQTRLASFLQAFEGGKHAGHTTSWNREVFAAIKSMEMFGVLNEKDPDKKHHEIEQYLGSMMSMKALYGDQAKLGEYLTLQKRAGTSFRAFNENFRYNVLPALVQEVGGATTGQQAMTAYQNIVAGVKLKNKTKSMLKTYGMYDAKNEKWAKEAGDLYSDDPTKFAAYLLEKAAKAHKLGLNDPELIKKLRRDLSTLLPDRHAAGFIDNLIANRENIHKHIEQMKLTRHEMEKIANGEFFAARTKGGAEGSVAAQWKNIMAAIGGPMMQPYIDRMNNLATVFNKLGASVSGFSARNPGASGAIGSAVVGAAAMLATLGALATGGLMIGAMRAGLGFLGVGGAARVGGAVATGGAGAALPVAAMIAAPIVAAKGVGLLARGLGLITGAAALAGRAILGFHLGVNGLAGGVLGRVFLTAKAATGLGLLTTGLYTFRSEIVDVAKEVANLAGKMYALGDSFFNTKLGSKETSKKLKDLIGAVADDLPDQNIGDRFANYVGKGLNNSGATSYARWWLDYDNSRTPYGDRAIGNGMVAPIYTDAELRRRTGINGATDYMFPWDKEKDGIYAGNAFKNPDNYTGKILDKYVYEKPPPMPQNQNASAAYFLDPASIPQSWGKTEVAVRSMVGVTIPPSIAIQVTGSLTGSVTNLQGSVTGSASAPIHAAPRGESAPVFSGRESGGYDG